MSRVRLPHLNQSQKLGLDGVDARLTPRIEVSFGVGSDAHAGINLAQRVQRFERWVARCSLRWPLSRIEGSTTAANRIGERRGPHWPARHAEVNLDLLDGRRTWGTAAGEGEKR